MSSPMNCDGSGHWCGRSVYCDIISHEWEGSPYTVSAKTNHGSVGGYAPMHANHVLSANALHPGNGGGRGIAWGM